MNVLVIGLGSMGTRRIRLLQGFGQIKKITGVDSRNDRREKIHTSFFCDVYDNIAEAYDDQGQIDCAFVCTSPLSHNEIIHEVLKRGTHVFTEINLVHTGYMENIALARKMKKILFLSSTFYYREEIKFIRERISGRSNLNYIYHIGQYLPDWHPWENYKDFFVGDKRTNGCREIMAIEFPWLIGTFGQVNSFHVLTGNMSKLKIPYRDNYLIQLEHEFGNKGLLAIDIVSPKAVRNLEIYGENVYFSWDGSPINLEYFDDSNRTMNKVQLYDSVEHIEGYSSFVVENAYKEEIKEFLDVVNGKAQPVYGFEKDLEILNLIDKIEELTWE